MTKTAFITGITGQDGSFLAELLLKKNYRVVGLVSASHDIGDQNIQTIKKQLVLETGDLLDKKSLEKIVVKYRPEEIYNLAGITFLPASWQKPALAFDVNALGLVRLLELVRDASPHSRIYQATSAKIFGLPREVPQTETTPLNPVDPYGVAKAAGHWLVRQFREHFRIFAVSGILYNHESERRGPEFVSRKITQTAVNIKLGLAKKLVLGNLEARQDWGYAPDYTKAMWLMLQQKTAQDYIIASGETHSVRDVCAVAFSYLNLDYQHYVTTADKLFRPAEAAMLRGDSAKARRILGWQPKTNFKDMIIKMVQNDLKLLKKGKS